MCNCAGGFQEWIENMTDQSHVSWAHHSAAGNRCAVRPSTDYFVSWPLPALWGCSNFSLSCGSQKQQGSSVHVSLNMQRHCSCNVANFHLNLAVWQAWPQAGLLQGAQR